MADRRAGAQSNGGGWLDSDDGQAGRRDHGHRLSVRRRPEDRPARARGARYRQGDPRLRPLRRSSRPSRRRGPHGFMNILTRRDLLRTAGVLGGGGALAYLFPPSIARPYALLRQAPDPVAATAAARAGTA